MKQKNILESKNKKMRPIKNLKKLIEYPKEGIISKTILKDDNVDIDLFCMTKNAKISPHTYISIF